MSIGIWEKNIKDNRFSPGGRLLMEVYQGLPLRGGGTARAVTEG